MKRRELHITEEMHDKLIDEKKISGETVSTLIRSFIKDGLAKCKKERSK